MNRYITSVFCLCLAMNGLAVNFVGQILDSNSHLPIEGVSISSLSAHQGTISNVDGFFSLGEQSDTVLFKLSCIGYKDTILTYSELNLNNPIFLYPQSLYLQDIIVTSQYAQVQKEPITTSSLSAIEIEQKLGNGEFVEILHTTPGVHANKQGGGWGDSEIYMRGFGNSNIAVLVNGVPINDMETGLVYWSNWAELGDVATKIQTQRGVGLNKLSAPNIGGTINIVTNGIETSRSGDVSYMIGNDGYNKIAIRFNSGITEHGWSISLHGSRTWGNGYAMGTNFTVYSYFINIAKRINNNHQINLVAFGAPQQHYMRSNALTQSEWNKIKDYMTDGDDWCRYNPDYGVNSNGIRKSSDFNKYHKPHISLNHIWQIDHNSILSTSVYASIGYGYSNSGDADGINASEYDWYGASEGILNTKYRKADGTFDYNAIEQQNILSSTGSQMIMSQLKTNYQWYGIVLDYSNIFLNCLTLSSGLDFRYYKGRHTNVVSDLFCGEYFIDPSRNNVEIANNSNAANAEWRIQQLHVGDVIHRDYDSYIIQSGIFANLEYAKNGITTFVGGSINYNVFWRYDRLFYDLEHARSNNIGIAGGHVKAGLNYHVGYHNVYINGGYISKVPPFKNGIFMSVNTSNLINRGVQNEMSASAEIGYGFHNPYVQLNISGYFVEWMNKTMTKKGTMDNGQQYYMNMTGVNAMHMGAEIDIKATPLSWLELNAMVSLGNWEWDSDSVKGLAYDIYGQALTPEGKVTTLGAPDQAWAIINMKGIKVGGSAQTTASFSVFFKPYKDIRFGIEYTLYDRNYAYFSLSGNKLKLGKIMDVSDAWRIPLGGSLDIKASYSFNIHKVDLSIAAQVNNVINQHYIEKAWNPSNIAEGREIVNSNNVYMFFSQGRTWNVKLKIGI